jgi:ribosomal protein L16 Arg81 hydroxylase
MILEQLLGTFPSVRFMEDHYCRLPHACPGGCRELLSDVGWHTIENMMGQPDVDILAGREGHSWEGNLPSTAEAARVVVAEGYTLGIRHAERHDPALADLALRFWQDFRAPIDVHLYCTPAGCPGFGWHYDAEEVFVLQARGTKEWSVRKNTVNPWPLVETIPRDMRYEREIMPFMRCTLAEGDWLYIPSGYWHSTRAVEESISLSVGIRAASGIDMLDFLRTRLLDSLRWRQRLPPAGMASPLRPGELVRCYRAILAELGQDLEKLLGQEDLIGAFLEHQRRLSCPQSLTPQEVAE